MASIFGRTPIKHGKLNWRLTHGGETFLDESTNIENIRNGHVSNLHALQLVWPSVKKTTRLKLSVQLTGSGYDVKNDWDFWVFPRNEAPKVAASADHHCLGLLRKRYPDLAPLGLSSTEKLRIVSGLKTSDVEHLAQGGDVVLLGTAPFTAYKQWPSFYPAKGMRPSSNGGTIIAKHSVFAGHPNDGWNDWLFFPLMEGANCVLFDGAIDMPFDPIMEIISSAGHVRKQALVFEDRVGKGRLFVTPLVFDMKNPSCVTMMDSLLKYVQSDAFQPPHEIAVGALERALAPPVLTNNILQDPGFEKSGYWVTNSGLCSSASREVHSGYKSLELVVKPEDIRRRPDFVSSVSTLQMSFPGNSPKRVKLSGWFKLEPAKSKAKVVMRAAIRHDDTRVRSSEFSISPQPAADGWQYVEKTFNFDGKVRYATLFVELSGDAATAWVDDVYLGGAENELGSSTNNGAASAAANMGGWANEKITQHFDLPVWYRVDNGEWKHGTDFSIDGEGIHTLSTKQSEVDAKPSLKSFRIDLSAPVVTLKIDPSPEQEAGVFTAKPNASYFCSAVDSLSGVKSIEVAIDGDKFVPYERPIALSPGTHTLRCRATDNAGNQSSEMTGDWITGTKRASIVVNVRDK